MLLFLMSSENGFRTILITKVHLLVVPVRLKNSSNFLTFSLLALQIKPELIVITVKEITLSKMFSN